MYHPLLIVMNIYEHHAKRFRIKSEDEITSVFRYNRVNINVAVASFLERGGKRDA
jgi:hypothetical protein